MEHDPATTSLSSSPSSSLSSSYIPMSDLITESRESTKSEKTGNVGFLLLFRFFHKLIHTEFMEHKTEYTSRDPRNRMHFDVHQDVSMMLLNRFSVLLSFALAVIAQPVTTDWIFSERSTGRFVPSVSIPRKFKEKSKWEQERRNGGWGASDLTNDNGQPSSFPNRHGLSSCSARYSHGTWERFIKENPYERYICLPSPSMLDCLVIGNQKTNSSTHENTLNTEKVFFVVFLEDPTKPLTSIQNMEDCFLGITPIFGPSVGLYKPPPTTNYKGELRRPSHAGRLFPACDLIPFLSLGPFLRETVTERRLIFMGDDLGISCYNNCIRNIQQYITQEKLWLVDFIIRSKYLLETYLSVPLPESVMSNHVPSLAIPLRVEALQNVGSCVRPKTKPSTEPTKERTTGEDSASVAQCIVTGDADTSPIPSIIRKRRLIQKTFQAYLLSTSKSSYMILPCQVPHLRWYRDMIDVGPCCMFGSCDFLNTHLPISHWDNEHREYMPHWFTECAYFSSPCFIAMGTPLLNDFKCQKEAEPAVAPFVAFWLKPSSIIVPPIICPLVFMQQVMDKLRALEELCIFDDIASTRFSIEDLTLGCIDLSFSINKSPCKNVLDTTRFLYSHFATMHPIFLTVTAFFSGCTSATLKLARSYRHVYQKLISRNRCFDSKTLPVHGQKSSDTFAANSRHSICDKRLSNSFPSFFTDDEACGFPILKRSRIYYPIWRPQTLPMFKETTYSSANVLHNFIRDFAEQNQIEHDRGDELITEATDRTKSSHIKTEPEFELPKTRAMIKQIRQIGYHGLYMSVVENSVKSKDTADDDQDSERPDSPTFLPRNVLINENVVTPTSRHMAKVVFSSSSPSDLLATHFAYLMLMFLYGPFRDSTYIYKESKTTSETIDSCSSDSLTNICDDDQDASNSFIADRVVHDRLRGNGQETGVFNCCGSPASDANFGFTREIGGSGTIPTLGHYWPNMDTVLVGNILYQIESSERAFCDERELEDLVSLSRLRTHLLVQNDLLTLVYESYRNTYFTNIESFMTHKHLNGKKPHKKQRGTLIDSITYRCDHIFDFLYKARIFQTQFDPETYVMGKDGLKMNMDWVISQLDRQNAHFETHRTPLSVFKTNSFAESVRISAKNYIREEVASQATDLDSLFSVITEQQKVFSSGRPDDEILFAFESFQKRISSKKKEETERKKKQNVLPTDETTTFPFFGDFEGLGVEKSAPSLSEKCIDGLPCSLESHACTSCGSDISPDTRAFPWTNLSSGLRQQLRYIFAKLPHEFCPDTSSYLDVLSKLSLSVGYSLEYLNSSDLYTLLAFTRNVILQKLKDGSLRSVISFKKRQSSSDV